LTLFLTHLAWASNADGHHLAVSAAFTAKIQYFYDSMCNLERLLKLISNKIFFLLGHLPGLSLPETQAQALSPLTSSCGGIR
jgi:hypothetical protein